MSSFSPPSKSALDRAHSFVVFLHGLDISEALQRGTKITDKQCTTSFWQRGTAALFGNVSPWAPYCNPHIWTHLQAGDIRYWSTIIPSDVRQDSHARHSCLRSPGHMMGPSLQRGPHPCGLRTSILIWPPLLNLVPRGLVALAIYTSSRVRRNGHFPLSLGEDARVTLKTFEPAGRGRLACPHSVLGPRRHLSRTCSNISVHNNSSAESICLRLQLQLSCCVAPHTRPSGDRRTCATVSPRTHADTAVVRRRALTLRHYTQLG